MSGFCCREHRADGARQAVPLRFFGLEPLPAERCEPVVLALALLLSERFPLRRHPLPSFEPVEGGVQGAMLEAEDVVGRPLDVPRNLVAVRRAEDQGAEDQQVERPCNSPVRPVSRAMGRDSTLVSVDCLPSRSCRSGCRHGR